MHKPIKKYFVQRMDSDGPGITIEVKSRNFKEIIETDDVLDDFTEGFTLYEQYEIEGRKLTSVGSENKIDVVIGKVVTKEEVLSNPLVMEHEKENIKYAFDFTARRECAEKLILQKSNGGFNAILKDSIVIDKEGNQLYPKLESSTSAPKLNKVGNSPH